MDQSESNMRSLNARGLWRRVSVNRDRESSELAYKAAANSA